MKRDPSSSLFPSFFALSLDKRRARALEPVPPPKKKQSIAGRLVCCWLFVAFGQREIFFDAERERERERERETFFFFAKRRDRNSLVVVV